MIVTYAGWDAMDASVPHDERYARRRQSRVVLTPRCWRQVRKEQASRGRRWQTSRSPGRSRYKPLKPLRREGRAFR